MKNKQAILIIAHNNQYILEKIIETLDSEYFDFYIHIDRKSNLDVKKIKSIGKISKVTILKQIDVRWAGYSQVQCELLLLKEAVKYGTYDFMHLISGVDFPIKTATEIYQYFYENKETEFVHFQSEAFPEEKVKWIKYYHFFRKFSRKNNLLKVLEEVSLWFQKVIGINRMKKSNFQFMTGANWFSITNDFATYVVSKEKEIEKQYRNTRSADEIFMQTLLFNSKFRDRVKMPNYINNYSSCMRCIDWERGTPYTYDINDLEMLKKSNYMFARKFDSNKDKEIIEELVKYLKK